MVCIVSFANSKGGVAKTTSVLGIGCCLAEQNKKVLMIDLDHQGNLSDDFGRGDEDYTITDLFEDPRFDTNKIVYQALDDGKKIENLFIMPADITLAVEARSAERYRHRLQILDDGIKRLNETYDFILIDCRPAIDLSIENALLISDVVVIPVDMDRRAVKGIDDLLEVVEEVKRKKSFVYTLIYTKVDNRNKKMLKATEDRIRENNYPALNTRIGISEKYKQASEEHRPFVCFAKNERPHNDYMELTKEFLEFIK